MIVKWIRGGGFRWGHTRRAPPFFGQLSCDVLHGYKTQLFNMSTTNKIADYFQREWEQTAQKRKGE